MLDKPPGTAETIRIAPTSEVWTLTMWPVQLVCLEHLSVNLVKGPSPKRNETPEMTRRHHVTSYD